MRFSGQDNNLSIDTLIIRIIRLKRDAIELRLIIVLSNKTTLT